MVDGEVKKRQYNCSVSSIDVVSFSHRICATTRSKRCFTSAVKILYAITAMSFVITLMIFFSNFFLFRAHFFQKPTLQKPDEHVEVTQQEAKTILLSFFFTNNSNPHSCRRLLHVVSWKIHKVQNKKRNQYSTRISNQIRQTNTFRLIYAATQYAHTLNAIDGWSYRARIERRIAIGCGSQTQRHVVTTRRLQSFAVLRALLSSYFVHTHTTH